MKKISLNRPKERLNKNCSYEIKLGDKTIAKLKSGEEKTIEIPTENKSEILKARIQWLGSENIEINNVDENKKITVCGNKFLHRTMPLFVTIMILTLPLLYALNIIPKSVVVGTYVLILIGIIGTVTIFKNKWLRVIVE